MNALSCMDASRLHLGLGAHRHANVAIGPRQCRACIQALSTGKQYDKGYPGMVFQLQPVEYGRRDSQHRSTRLAPHSAHAPRQAAFRRTFQHRTTHTAREHWVWRK